MRPKAIVYALFGYQKERQAGCFDFNSYLRGLLLNIRMNRLLFPDWTIILETDRSTFSAYQHLLMRIGIDVELNEEMPLCKSMLWRMKPIFHRNKDMSWKYSHVLCRDLDSPATYREVQAVETWIHHDKAMHAITDSVSHCLELLGGMIGAKPDYFTERVAQSWEDMLALAPNIDYHRKGSDQDFLNRHIYPRFAQHGNDSITQHYFNGIGKSFLSDYNTCLCPPVQGHEPRCKHNVELGLHADLKESNSVCGHIGAAGAYMPTLMNFLRKYKDRFEDLIAIERQYPRELFHWAHDGTFE